MPGKLRFGSSKKIAAGQVYRSTNGKYIKIEAVNETHFRYMILKCDPKKGRPKRCRPGAVVTSRVSNITNFIGPIDFELITYKKDDVQMKLKVIAEWDNKTLAMETIVYPMVIRTEPKLQRLLEQNFAAVSQAVSREVAALLRPEDPAAILAASLADWDKEQLIMLMGEAIGVKRGSVIMIDPAKIPGAFFGLEEIKKMLHEKYCGCKV